MLAQRYTSCIRTTGLRVGTRVLRLYVKKLPEAVVPTLSNRIPDARAALRRVLEDQQQRSQRRIFRISFVNIFCLRYHKQITQLIALWVTVTELPLFEFRFLQLVWLLRAQVRAHEQAHPQRNSFRWIHYTHTQSV